MSTDDAPSGKPVSRPVGVPRRFAVGTLMVIVAMYSVLFAFLTSLGANPVVFGIVAVFFTGVGVGQAVFFRGTQPRDASYLAGILLCPAILLAAFLADRVFGLSELNPGHLGIETVPQLVSAMAYLAMVGALPGYIAGCAAAGVFFVMDRIKKAREGPTAEADRPEASATDERPPLDERLWLPVRSAIVGLSPCQKGRPLREAVNVFSIIAVLVGLAVPFQEWAWWIYLLGTAAAALVLAFLRGLFLCRWKTALMLIVLGGMGAIGPGVIFRSIFWDPGVRIAEYVPLFMIVGGGGAVGLMVATALGWARWRLERGSGAKRHRKATRRLVVAFTLSLVLIYGGVSLWLFQVLRRPEQRALAEIDRLGGDATNMPPYYLGWPVRSVSFRGRDIEDDDLRVLSAFGSLATVDLFDTPIGDAGLAHLECLGGVRILDLGGTRITDAGLRHLAGLAELEILCLNHTRVTDAGLQHLERLANLEWLLLDHTQVRGPGLTHLKNLKSLSRLTLGGSEVSDEGLQHLRGMPSLAELFLAETRVTDAGLQHLQDMPDLARLDLARTRVTGEGLEHLVNLTGLESLTLADCQIVDSGLVYLKGLTNLRSLDLSGTQVTDSGLECLKGLTNLQSLDLSGTQITDGGLVHLRSLTGLRFLRLDGTEITDAGLAHLKGLKNLDEIDLTDTQVTAGGVEKLEEALPDCWVSRFGPPGLDEYFPPAEDGPPPEWP